VLCELDTQQYPKGIVVSDAEMAALNIKPAEFHGEWNYTISPNTDPPNCDNLCVYIGSTATSEARSPNLSGAGSPCQSAIVTPATGVGATLSTQKWRWDSKPRFCLIGMTPHGAEGNHR
jgi:hypothetical protein